MTERTTGGPPHTETGPDPDRPLPTTDDPGGGRAKGYSADPPGPNLDTPRREGVVSDPDGPRP
jgi:hypothetical protein